LLSILYSLDLLSRKLSESKLNYILPDYSLTYNIKSGFLFYLKFVHYKENEAADYETSASGQAEENACINSILLNFNNYLLFPRDSLKSVNWLPGLVDVDNIL